MTPRERDAIVASLLDMEDDNAPERVREWVLVAHVHTQPDTSECDGSLRMAGTTHDTEHTSAVLMGGILMCQSGPPDYLEDGTDPREWGM